MTGRSLEQKLLLSHLNPAFSNTFQLSTGVLTMYSTWEWNCASRRTSCVLCVCVACYVTCTPLVIDNDALPYALTNRFFTFVYFTLSTIIVSLFACKC